MKYLILVLLLTFQSILFAEDHCVSDSKILKLAKIKQIILFGELHGTKEMPLYFSNVICNIVNAKIKVKIGIEQIPSQTQFLQTYINSKGTVEDKKTLIFNGHWNDDYQDGRSSLAIFHLVDSIRKLRKNGADISMFTFDSRDLGNRDQTMADNISNEINKDPDVLHVVITGNIHSRTMKGTPWDKNYQTMGYLLVNKKLSVASILFLYNGGNAWVCTPECKVTQFKTKSKRSWTDFLLTSDGAKNNHHDYILGIGKITASLPAYKNTEKL